MGFWVGQECQGFDYDDFKVVKVQLEGFCEVVCIFKDYLVFFMWGVGNEVDLFYENFKVWNVIEDIVVMIYEEDFNYLIMIVIVGFDVVEV